MNAQMLSKAYISIALLTLLPTPAFAESWVLWRHGEASRSSSTPAEMWRLIDVFEDLKTCKKEAATLIGIAAVKMKQEPTELNAGYWIMTEDGSLTTTYLCIPGSMNPSK